MVAPLEQTHRVPQFDPQGHRLGPIGTLAAQAGLIWGLIWVAGALGDLLLPPALGVFALALALGVVLLAPRRLVMEFPVSLSVMGLICLAVGSVLWSVDPASTSAVQRALLPATFAIFIAAGLLTLKDFTDALIWCIRIVVVVTCVALIIFPSSRVHVGVQSGGVEDYAGWHGLFNHKNNMMEFFVFAIPTILIFHKQGIVKWLTLGVIGVLSVGSTSSTGLSAGFFVVVAWVWLYAYHSQSKEDRRDSTLLFLTSLIGSLAIISVALSSFGTLTNAYGKDTTLSGRTLIWEAVIDAILRRPLLGHGFGALFNRENVSNETSEVWRQVGFAASHAHNGALDLAQQLGLIGLAVFMILWASIVWRGWEAIARQPDLGIWIMCIVSSNLLMSFSEDVFFGAWFAIFGFMKMLLMRREESLNRPSWTEGPLDKWAI